MDIVYREGKKRDCFRIAELDYIASGGAIEYLFHDLISNMSPTQIVAANLENDSYPHSYRSALVAEDNQVIIGMSLSFPGKFHTMTEEMKKFFPRDRMEHFKHFFRAPVEDSYFLDALCVDKKYRNKGVGSKIVDLVKTKARSEDYGSLSLLVFADNIIAQNMYKKNGFKIIQKVKLKRHELIPHKGGCFLMQADI